MQVILTEQEFNNLKETEKMWLKNRNLLTTDPRVIIINRLIPGIYEYKEKIHYFSSNKVFNELIKDMSVKEFKDLKKELIRKENENNI